MVDVDIGEARKTERPCGFALTFPLSKCAHAVYSYGICILFKKFKVNVIVYFLLFLVHHCYVKTDLVFLLIRHKFLIHLAVLRLK